VPERGELRDLITYALASCGSGDYNADVKKAVEVCVSAGKLSSAYMLILYILNGGEVPRYHPIPLPYVTRIEDICVVNPEGLATAGVEALALPSPDYYEVTIIKEVDKESKKHYKAVLANVWGVVITYSTEDGGKVSKVLIITLTRVGAEIMYTAVDPPPHISKKIADICSGSLKPPEITSEEGIKLLKKTGLGSIEELVKKAGAEEGISTEEVTTRRRRRS
jgi:hypothetical protein